MRLTYMDLASPTTPIPSQVLREVQLTYVLPNLLLLHFLRSFATSFTIDFDAYHSSHWCITFPLEFTLITSFFILLHHIHLSIHISITSIFLSWVFLMDQHFVPYNKAFLSATPQKLPFILGENFLSHNILIYTHSYSTQMFILFGPLSDERFQS